MVWRRTIAVALFALLAAGCGGGGGEEGQESLRVTKTEGPIFGMAVADSVDHEGKLVAPSSTFAADVPRLTVVVHMGKVTGSLLTITWYQERRKLFEHTLEVGSFDSAYSTGKNPGTLAPGRYRAEATLEGTTQAVEWDVAQGSGTTAAVSDVPQGSPPAAGGTGVIDSPGTRGGDISNLDPGDGGSGSGPDCELRLFTGYFDNLDRDADLADIIAEADCDGIVDVAAAALGGPFRDVGALRADRYARVAFTVDPCSLPGGSDLPDSTVRWRATTGVTEAAWTVKLDKDTTAPEVRVKSSPSPGEPVEEGDKIEIRVQAEDKRSGPSWQEGLLQIQVIEKRDGLVGQPKDLGRGSKTCNQKKVETHKVTYTVPANPPSPVKLCAIAEDVVGNENAECATFPTAKEYSFAPVRLEWPCTGTELCVYQLISGETCGVGGVGKWEIEATTTNKLDPSNTGTSRFPIRVARAGVAAQASVPFSGVNLTILPGGTPRARIDVMGTSLRTATTKLAKGPPCEPEGVG